jgi:hypothetical protein
MPLLLALILKAYHKDDCNRTASFFPLVYKLIELALLVPCQPRLLKHYSFSATKVIKSKLHNKIANDWFNNLRVCYIC